MVKTIGTINIGLSLHSMPIIDLRCDNVYCKHYRDGDNDNDEGRCELQAVTVDDAGKCKMMIHKKTMFKGKR